MDKKYDVLEITNKIIIRGDFHADGDISMGQSDSKLGFFGSSPVIQQEMIDENSISELIQILKNYGLLY